jgi:hypothetical protein
MPDKMPVKTRRFILTADYDGWWCDIRVNPPLGLYLEKMNALQIADSSKPEIVAPPLYDLLNMIIIAWNFTDENGQALPLGIDGLKQLPLDLLVAIGAKVKGETLEVPLAQGNS